MTPSRRQPTIACMFIYSLALENIKSYTRAAFTFSDGVNAIVGRNGAGKSTILEAIGFALFNAGRARDLARQGTTGGHITVEFESSLDQRRYRVVRRTSGPWYVHDVELNARLCEAVADVSAFLREHMGLSRSADLSKIFEDAVGVSQGKVTAAFALTPQLRKGVFDPLLEVEEYDTAVKNLLDTRYLQRERQNEVDVAYSRLAGVLEQLPEVGSALTRIQAEVADGRAAHAGALRRLAEAVAQRTAWESRRSAFVEAQRDHASAVALSERTADLHDAAQRALAEAEGADARVKKHWHGYETHLQARAERVQLEADAQQRQKLLLEQSALRAEQARAQDAITRAAQELSEVEQQEAVAATLAEAVQREDALRAELETARAAAQQASLQRGERTRLETALLGERARLESVRADAGRLANEQTALAQAVAAEREAQSRIETTTGEMSARKTLAESVKEQSAALDGTAAHGATLCPLCEQPLTPDHVHDLRARNHARVEELRSEYAELKRALTLHENERSAHQQRQRQLADTIAQLPSAATLAQAERYVADLVEQLQAVDARLATLQSEPDRVATLEAALHALGEPRVAQAVALRTAARRPQIVQAQRTAVQAQSLAAQRESALAATLAQFASLDDTLARVAASEAATQAAWQEVIAHQQAAAQLPLRIEASAAAQRAFAEANSALAATAERLAAAERDYDDARADLARREEADAQADASAIASRLELQTAEAERLARQHAALLEQQREQQLLHVELERMKHQAVVLDMMRNTIKAAGPQITRALIGQIGAYASQWFGELTGDFSRRLQWDEEYTITLEQEGRVLEFKALSGGEQMAAALSVRLALLRELGKIDIAFFDEPTAHLDVERREALAKQIMQVKGFRQLFVISHDDTFEHQTDNVIHIERAYEGSRVLGG